LEQIFSSQKNKLYEKIKSAINNIKDIENIYSSNLIEKENPELNNDLGEEFERLLNDNYIKDISDLIWFCKEKNMQLENDLIKILKKNKPIFKKAIMQLIESKDPIKIKKCRVSQQYIS
jgi:hypothetical protein